MIIVSAMYKLTKIVSYLYALLVNISELTIFSRLVVTLDYNM